MFVLTCSWKNHKLLCNSYGKSCKLFVQFSETPHCFILPLPPFLILQVSQGYRWGGRIFVGLFSLAPFSTHALPLPMPEV